VAAVAVSAHGNVCITEREHLPVIGLLIACRCIGMARAAGLGDREARCGSRRRGNRVRCMAVSTDRRIDILTAASHQIANFVRFCETVVKVPTIRKIKLVTSYDEKTDMAGLNEKIEELKQSLLEIDVLLTVELSEVLHDREICIDNGWTIKIGRGLDFYQKPDGWFAIGANDFSLRKCLETKIDIFRASSTAKSAA
jgi:Phospholipase D-like domain at C-terminus of MIT